VGSVPFSLGMASPLYRPHILSRTYCTHFGCGYRDLDKPANMGRDEKGLLSHAESGEVERKNAFRSGKAFVLIRLSGYFSYFFFKLTESQRGADF
jgi:hypothetical protein